MKTLRAFCLLLLLLAAPLRAQTILVAPYVQPGNGSTLAGADVKTIAWLTDQTAADFVVEYSVTGAAMRQAKVERVQLDFGLPKPRAGAASVPAKAAGKPGAGVPTDLEDFKKEAVKESAVAAPEEEQHYFSYAAALDGLPFDSAVRYRVRIGDRLVREGSFKTRASAAKPIRFVAVGDLANGKPQQNGIAWQIAQQQPDFMIALGDIVYPHGRVNEYMHHFWTTYNDVAQPGPKTGAPLFASIPLYPVLGNHDTDTKLPDYPDAWGAYYFFHVPQNGPGLGPWSMPLGRDQAAADNFRAKVGATYPAMNVYSWDVGSAHFLALDSNGYAKTDDPKLLAWIEADLRGSRQPWKFVCMHAPAFHTSREHYTEQKMRLWEPLFEKCGVDVVFAGHVHNYQRSKPLRFTPVGGRDVRGRINGELRLDERFDGVKNTTPDGVIHIVSGGGGAPLYSVDFAKTVEALKKEHGANYTPLTAKYAAQHSFSLVDLTPDTFTLRQIAIGGEEIDRFTLTKNK